MAIVLTDVEGSSFKAIRAIHKLQSLLSALRCQRLLCTVMKHTCSHTQFRKVINLELMTPNYYIQIVQEADVTQVMFLGYLCSFWNPLKYDLLTCCCVCASRFINHAECIKTQMSAL